MKAILLGLTAVLTTGASALADQKITINQCVMGYANAGDDSIIGHGVDFTNKTHHVVTAIRFNFVFLTPFNEVLGSATETDTGTFTPGVEIDHTTADAKATLTNGGSIANLFGGRHGVKTYHWQVQNPSQETLSKMKVACEVDAVSFQDGTVWTAPQER